MLAERASNSSAGDAARAGTGPRRFGEPDSTSKRGKDLNTAMKHHPYETRVWKHPAMKQGVLQRYEKVVFIPRIVCTSIHTVVSGVGRAG
jgi:hypothetical protein